MIKYLLLIFIFLVGCKQNVIIKREIKEVPVLVFTEVPSPIVVEQLALPIYALSANSTNEEIAKAFVQTIEILKSYSDSLNASLQPYREETE